MGVGRDHHLLEGRRGVVGAHSNAAAAREHGLDPGAGVDLGAGIAQVSDVAVDDAAEAGGDVTVPLNGDRP
jgi:hypothetical protein